MKSPAYTRPIVHSCFPSAPGCLWIVHGHMLTLDGLGVCVAGARELPGMRAPVAAMLDNPPVMEMDCLSRI